MLLGNNCFEDEGAKSFKSAIADNTTLEVLDLSWNNFKSKGATLLAEALQVNSRMRTHTQVHVCTCAHIIIS